MFENVLGGIIAGAIALMIAAVAISSIWAASTYSKQVSMEQAEHELFMSDMECGR